MKVIGIDIGKRKFDIALLEQGKVRSKVFDKTRVSKVGHTRLHRILYLPAMSATRYNPAAKALSKRLKTAGKPGKAIICAVMRKLTHWIFGVLKSKQPFDVKLALAKG